MLPVCSATPCCSSHSQISFQGGLRSFCPLQKDFESKCIIEDKAAFGLSNGTYLQRISFKTQAAKSLYFSSLGSNDQSVSMAFTNSSLCSNKLHDIKCNPYDNCRSSVEAINELHPMGKGEMKYVESYDISALEEGFTDQLTENADSLTGTVEPETMLTIDMTPETPSLGPESLDFDNDSLSSVKTSFDDFLGGVQDSFGTSVNKGANFVKSSLDTITSSITSINKSASEAVDNALSRVLSTVDQTGELARNRLTGFSSDLKEATSKASVTSVDILRSTIVAAENIIAKGASFALNSYGSAKELLPSEIRDAINLSEERGTEILRPVATTLQQVYIAIEGLEKSLGLDTNDPVVPFVLFVGTSATLCGYSGDVSPQLTLELLMGKENSVLIDVRPEVLREKNGIPDLRRTARFRYASVILPEVDASVRKLVKDRRDLDDTLIAAVVRNLKAVQDSSKVIVMDADGTRSKGIARSLRRLGVKRSYLVQGGFQSWLKQGMRIKELKPETALSILNEEAEAILEDVRPSPVQVLGYGVGFVAALYALLEWEKTLQLIGIVGLGQTIYRRFSTYENPEDFKQDVRLLLTPFRVGAQAVSWAAGKLENKRLGLPTSPSSSDVQNRVLKAAALHESQPSDIEGIQNPSPESVAPISDNVDLSEA